MFIESYEYHTGTTITDLGVTIEGVNRSREMTREYLKKFPGLTNLALQGTTALLYAGGPAIHHSDMKNFDTGTNGSIVIKTQIGANAYLIAKALGDTVEYVSINTNTCASSMFSLHEAMKLVHEYTNVIIYAEEMIDATLLKLFSQLGIGIVCGDAVGIIHLTLNRTSRSIAEITDTSWVWNNDTSPMSVSTDGYTKAISKISTKGITHVKVHGTGTAANDIAEECGMSCIEVPYEVLKYKKDIGHTQGASALVELCMALDEVPRGSSVLCLASGLGAMYGCCKVIR